MSISWSFHLYLKTLNMVVIKFCKLKGTVSVISSDLACKGDNALFILVSLSFRKTTLFEWEKRRYLLHFRSYQCFVVSRALSSLHVGSLEITLTVPLSLTKLGLYIYITVGKYFKPSFIFPSLNFRQVFVINIIMIIWHLTDRQIDR